MLTLILFLSEPGQPRTLWHAVAGLADLNVGSIVLLSAGILVAAFLLQPLQLSLVRLLEGYWGISWYTRPIAALFIERQRKKREQIEVTVQSNLRELVREQVADQVRTVDKQTEHLSDRLLKYFPSEKRLLPTTLGNVLRAAEENAGKPYELDAIIIWPRLYHILPEKTVAIANDQRLQLDLSVRFCGTFIIAAAVSLLWCVAHQVAGWYLAIPAAAMFLAWLSYRGAIASALAYGEEMRSAIDLHRFDLLRALHLPLPDDRESENRLNTELCMFLRQGMPLPQSFRYEHPSQSKFCDVTPR